MSNSGPSVVEIDAYFAKRRVLIFSVPGAFTPTCSNSHLPGFISKFDQFKRLKIDAIACTAVNDSFVMHAWGKSAGADNIDMLADGNGDFVRSIGLEIDASAFEMGQRGRRFAFIADNGVLSHLFVEPPGEFQVSSAEHILTVLHQSPC
ncbi:MAG: peroxiredoxin [Xanthomonadales bacterium]|nr:peroxiredoxin [Xanthomonadales bacterium]